MHSLLLANPKKKKVVDSMELNYRKRLASLDLTSRQTDVALVLIEGCTSKEISERLFITEKAVKFHLLGIYKKAGVPSRAKFLVKFYRDL